MGILRTYPLFSACGLNCALCPHHHTDGMSRCPGCGGEGFYEKHPSCGILSCSTRRGAAVCSLCHAFPCKRFDGEDLYDSFITYRNRMAHLMRVKTLGLPSYYAELQEKEKLLVRLLADFDDGRSKGFYCLAVNLLPADAVSILLNDPDVVKSTGAGKKESAKAVKSALHDCAHKLGLSLILRKKAAAISDTIN